jgi:cholesterol transport system auxiliary component
MSARVTRRRTGAAIKPWQRTGAMIGLALALLPALAACSLLAGSNTEPNLYELSPKSTFPEHLPTINAQLLVQTPAASAGLTSARIAIKLKPETLEYVENAAWTDVAPNVVQTLIIESFDNVNKVKGVAREGSGLRVDFLLKTDLREFQAELYKGRPKSVLVRISAKLVRWRTREIIASFRIWRRVPLKNTKIDSIVEGYNEALGKVLKRLVTWTIKTMAKDIRQHPIVRD